MGCFLVSTAEAVIVTAAKKAEEKKEIRLGEGEAVEETKRTSIPLSRKLTWLKNMLWGGAVLLLFEHIWHGEVVAWFPFLTAMSDPADTAVMLHEMATVGVCMALLITVVWAGMCIVADAIVKREAKESASETV
ncbi:MAG: hypothetical protein K6G12_07405 [Lachnospiraceae bacterium]|nr:hypothetical protein [Lachnospiraceae bacterium]